MIRRIPLLACVLTWLVVGGCAPATASTRSVDDATRLDTMWLRRDIEFLADPRLDGRAAGVVRLTDGRLIIHGAEGRRRSLAVQANARPRFSLTLLPGSSGRSDDYSFVAGGVPAMHITTGDHRDYHRATDTADRIDFAGLARITDYVERLVRAEASRR